jgi:hypothetical protein
MKNKKLTNLVTGSLLATTLVFSAGAGAAFAEGDGMAATEESTVENVADDSAVDEGTVTDESATEASEVDEEVQATDDKTVAADEEEEAPSLVPGDFFYFVKLMAEKIKLAVTFVDYEEAKLLADFTAERIAESKVLLAEGKTNEAAELLKTAIATQEQASAELTETEEATQEDATETDGTAEVKLLNNVNGLLNALGNVKNETARDSIMKNLEKSFRKLDKKLAKLEEKDAKFAEKVKQTEEQVVDGQVSDDDAVAEKVKKGKALGKVKKEKASEVEVTPVVEETTTEDTVQTEPITETETPASDKAVVKQEKAAAKDEQKQNKAVAKVEQKQNKANGAAKNGNGNQGEKGNGKGNN